MFKTVIAATAVATASASINADFMSGFQTGVFLSDFKGFEDYSCPIPEMSDKVDNYVNMYNMAKGMMGVKAPKKGQNKSLKPSDDPTQDLFSKFDNYVDQMGVIASVMDSNYDGGDFCQGLTMGFEGRQVMQSMAVHAVKNAVGGKGRKF